MKVAEKAWRVVAMVNGWDHADSMRKTIQDDSPALEVRIKFEAGRYQIQVR